MKMKAIIVGQQIKPVHQERNFTQLVMINVQSGQRLKMVDILRQLENCIEKLCKNYLNAVITVEKGFKLLNNN